MSMDLEAYNERARQWLIMMRDEYVLTDEAIALIDNMLETGRYIAGPGGYEPDDEASGWPQIFDLLDQINSNQEENE